MRGREGIRADKHALYIYIYIYIYIYFQVSVPLNIFFLHRKQPICSYNLLVYIAILLVLATILLVVRT